MYIRPLTTARMSVRRLPPPGRGGGMSGAITAHSSSVRSLGYLRRSRLYLGRFSSVHIGRPSPRISRLSESQTIPTIQGVLRRTLKEVGRLAEARYAARQAVRLT